MPKPPKLLKPRKFIRIFSEGAVTECKYFDGVFRDRKLSAAEIRQPKDHSPLGLVDAALEAKKEANKDKIPAEDTIIWVVFDRDQHANIPGAIQKANANGIGVAFSNICFEYWVLLHYVKTSAPFQSCDDVIRQIKTHNPTYSKEKTYDIYAALSDKIGAAMEHAEWLANQNRNNHPNNQIWDINPYTDVHELLNILLSIH